MRRCRSHRYSKFPERLMIFRDICRVSRSSSHLLSPLSPPPPPPPRRLRRCIQKQSRHELDNLDIAWHVLATSMRRFHSSFRIFSISSCSLSPSPLVGSDSSLRPRASLVAALTHHLLYIALAETPDIIFDILFCRRRSSDREVNEERKRKRGVGKLSLRAVT